MRHLLLGLLSIFFLSLHSCVSFESASTTGKLGENLISIGDLYNDSVTVCDFLRVIDPKSISETYCQKYSVSIQKLAEGLSVISAYGTSLQKIAEEKEFDQADQLEMVINGGQTLKWFKLKDDSEEGIKQISAAVQKLVGNSVRRKQLDRIVKEVNVPLQTVVNKILIPELENRKTLYKKLELHLENIIAEQPSLKPDMRVVRGSTTKDTLFARYNDLDMLLSKKFKSDLREEIVKIESCRQSLKAFAIAHQKLTEEASKIGTAKDAEVAKEILEALKDIYTGINKF